MGHEGYLSYVQYRPSLASLEAVNIGVLLYDALTGATRLRMVKTNQRVRQFFGKQNWSYVERLKLSLRERIQTSSFGSERELSAFISKRVNGIQLSELQSVSISDIDRDADRYLLELLSAGKPERRGRIDRAFGNRLLEAGIRDLVRGSVSVRLPVFEEPVRAPYGYLNGKFNLISPVQFDNDPKAILAKAGQRALEGRLLHDNPDPEKGPLRLVVVAKFADEMDSSIRNLIEVMLGEHDVPMYTFDNLEPLFADIRHAAAMHAEE